MMKFLFSEVATPTDGKYREEGIYWVVVKLIRLMKVVILKVYYGLERNSCIWLNQ